MLNAEENRILTQTGPATSMGAVFRHYWQPALLSRELEPDGPPQWIRILGEDFVAFRETNGSVGVLESACSHRGANLFLGAARQADDDQLYWTATLGILTDL